MTVTGSTDFHRRPRVTDRERRSRPVSALSRGRCAVCSMFAALTPPPQSRSLIARPLGHAAAVVASSPSNKRCRKVKVKR
jgi:hypothetical protein